MRKSLMLVVALLMLFIAGCGSSDDGDADDATQPAATMTAATGAATQPAATATMPAAAATATAPAAAATATAPAATATTPAATATSTTPALSGTLTVFAAASLTDAFNAMSEVLTAANPDLTIEFNYAGSQQLVTQLVEGADADVFASANQTQLDAALEGGVVMDEGTVFTRNRLVIIVPADNPAGISEPADLAQDGLKLVIANEEVPVGRYTLEMLDLMTADPAFGADFRERVEANVVSLEDNVKQVVAKVQLGEADAGVVYVSDVTADVADDVEMIEVPAALNVIARYPIAQVVDGDSALAAAFIDFVLSDEGQAILEEFGFTALE